MGGLDRRVAAYTARHELHAATRPHALALHPLQLRLHHILVDDVIRRHVVSMTSFYVPCVLMIFLYWRTFRAISARAHKMAAAARRRKSIEVTMTGSGGARARAVEVTGGEELEQQRPAAATVVVHAVVNGSGGVDTASTPIIGNQKDSAAKYADYQTMCSGGDNDQAGTGTSDAEGGHGEGSTEEGVGTTTSAVADVDNAELAVRRPSQRQRRHRRLMVVQPLHDSPSLSRRPLFRSGRQQQTSADSKQRAGKTAGSGGLRLRRSAIFAFGLQRIVQKPEKLSTKRERKATQTLAIVLGLSEASQICFFYTSIMSIEIEI